MIFSLRGFILPDSKRKSRKKTQRVEVKGDSEEPDEEEELLEFFELEDEEFGEW
jgi:hypothetical protein